SPVTMLSSSALAVRDLGPSKPSLGTGLRCASSPYAEGEHSPERRRSTFRPKSEAAPAATGQKVFKASQNFTEGAGYVHLAAHKGSVSCRVAVSYLIPKGAEITTFLK